MARRRPYTGYQLYGSSNATTTNPSYQRERASTVAQVPEMTAYHHALARHPLFRADYNLALGPSSTWGSHVLIPSTSSHSMNTSATTPSSSNHTADSTNDTSVPHDPCPDPLPEPQDPRWQYDPSPNSYIVRPGPGLSDGEQGDEQEQEYPLGLRSRLLYKGKPGSWLAEEGLIPDTDYDGNKCDPADVLVEMLDMWFERKLKKDRER